MYGCLLIEIYQVDIDVGMRDEGFENLNSLFKDCIMYFSGFIILLVVNDVFETLNLLFIIRPSISYSRDTNKLYM